MKNVSIIIVSYNTKDLISSCIESIQKYVPSNMYEIIVVDNNSHDGTPEFLKKKFSEITLIQNDKNVGFGPAINIASRQAKGEFLLFLNSDAQLTDDSVQTMVKTFERSNNIAVVGGLLYYPDGSMQRSFSSFYDLSSAFLLLFGGDRAELKTHVIDHVTEVDWVSGGFMMIKKSVFEKINGFDEAFFMYIEDMELCKRVRQHGYSIVVQPRARVQHLGQGSSNRGFAIEHIYRGLQYYYKKHKSIFSYLMVKLMLAVKAVGVLLVGYVTQNKQLIKTYRKALTTL